MLAVREAKVEESRDVKGTRLAAYLAQALLPLLHATAFLLPYSLAWPRDAGSGGGVQAVGGGGGAMPFMGVG